MLGPVAPAKLGVTLPHEHLLIDSVGNRPPSATTAAERRKWLLPITLENHYDARRNVTHYRDNMLLASVEDAVDEVVQFRLAGGGSIVDVTSGGLARNPAGLRRIAQAAGVHVVMGCGYYVHEYHPPEVAQLSEEEIRDQILLELAEGDATKGVRPGIIGEIGLTWPVHPDEVKVLRAAAGAQAASGAALTIHPGRHPDAPLEAVRIVADAGGDLSRTAIGHLDRTLFELADLRGVALTGCYLEFDLFGLESAYYSLAPIDMPNDGRRVDLLVALAEQGFADRLLCSHDVDCKVRLTKFGGEGYAHILRHVVPLMLRKGMSQVEVDQILIENPTRLLTIG